LTEARKQIRLERAAVLVRRLKVQTRTCSELNVQIILPKTSGLQFYRT